MKLDFISVCCGRIALSVLIILGTQPLYAQSNGSTKSTKNNSDTGLLPIERSTVDPEIVKSLFPIDTPPGDVNKGANTGIGLGNGSARNTGLPLIKKDPQSMSRATVDEEFRCNLFENAPYETIMSAVNSLNQAVNSPSCSGNSKVDVKSVVDSNKKIADVVTSLRNFVENPETVQTENTSDIVNNVDQAIRAANNLATTFAQTDILNEQCRKQMNGGQIASSLSDIMNGLTPYALMAAQMTGGTAAIPFIVGGSIVTTAIGSMSKIIEENTSKVYDAQVRRAIVENTCQFIRLDQKYKFLIKSRSEQLMKITADISASQALFSSQLKGVSSSTQNIMNRKKYLDQVSLSMKDSLAQAQIQLELDKQFLKSTSDDIKICQLGIQMAVLANDRTSYVSNMLGSLDTALTAYGSANVAQAMALKSSADIAIKSLQSLNQKQYSVNTDFRGCTRVTKSFIETVDKSGALSKQLVKVAQADIEKQVKGSNDYGLLKQPLQNLSSKQVQAERVAGSLENLRSHATKIAQSEIDSEMDRLRRGLLAPRSLGIRSPVSAWFTYVRGLHQADVSKFQQGLENLRSRAYNMTKSGKAEIQPSFWAFPEKKAKAKDKEDAFQLRAFTLDNLPLGTRDHTDTCREMQDVWNRWVTAVDHLAAMDSFCGMIEPYIYDNRSEDRELVNTCRGYTAVSGGDMGASLSLVAKMKDKLVKESTRDWALYLDKVMQSMVCADTASTQMK